MDCFSEDCIKEVLPGVETESSSDNVSRLIFATFNFCVT